jgi:hypothetical protein
LKKKKAFEEKKKKEKINAPLFLEHSNSTININTACLLPEERELEATISLLVSHLLRKRKPHK